METAQDVDLEDRYHDGRGVALYVVGYVKVWEPDTALMTDDDGNEWFEPTGEGEWIDDPSDSRIVVRMVGDDHKFTVDVSDLVALDDDGYCSGCGQVGCGWS